MNPLMSLVYTDPLFISIIIIIIIIIIICEIGLFVMYVVYWIYAYGGWVSE